MGLTFHSLDDPARLGEVLRAQKYDLLLVDAGDADNLERQAQSVPSKPVVLPVVYQSNKAAAAEADLDGYHLLYSVRADLLRRLGSSEEAAKAYAQALAHVTNDAERRFLTRRLQEVSPVA